MSFAGADALRRHRELAAAAVTRHQVALSASSSLPAHSQRRVRCGAQVIKESRGRRGSESPVPGPC